MIRWVFSPDLQIAQSKRSAMTAFNLIMFVLPAAIIGLALFLSFRIKFRDNG